MGRFNEIKREVYSMTKEEIPYPLPQPGRVLPFQSWFWDEWFDDDDVLALTHTEYSVYHRLLGRMWLKGGYIRIRPGSGAAWAKRVDLTHTDWDRVWVAIMPLLVERDGDYFTQKRLAQEWMIAVREKAVSGERSAPENVAGGEQGANRGQRRPDPTVTDTDTESTSTTLARDTNPSRADELFDAGIVEPKPKMPAVLRHKDVASVYRYWEAARVCNYRALHKGANPPGTPPRLDEATAKLVKKVIRDQGVARVRMAVTNGWNPGEHHGGMNAENKTWATLPILMRPKNIAKYGDGETDEYEDATPPDRAWGVDKAGKDGPPKGYYDA